MQEIIYIQSGPLSNHIGQHFWNAQECYLDWDAGHDPAAPEVNHDVSFREGVARDGSETYLPRVLIFDSKDAFGSLSKYNTLYEEAVDPSHTAQPLWSGGPEEHRQPLYPKSRYLQELEEEERQANDANPSSTAPKPSPIQHPPTPKTWTDYTRVYYHPRSLHPVPYPLSGVFDTWNEGVEAFARVEQEDGVWENDFRAFAEGCNLLQGLHITIDASASFSSLAISLLDLFRDEYPKHPILTFLPLSHKPTLDMFDVGERRRSSCEARTIWELSEMGATIVPLQHADSWARGSWSAGLASDLNLSSMYHSSALLSAHMESATLPLRMKGSDVTLASLGALLNYHRDTPISHLTGMLPLYDVDSAKDAFDFSALRGPHLEAQETWSMHASYRGAMNTSHESSLLKALEEVVHLHEPLLQLSFTPLTYPIPSSFPPLLSNPAPSLSLLSALSTTSRTASILEQSSGALEEVARHGLWSGLGEGWEKEDVREVGDGLRGLREGYVKEEDETEEEMGEDEEA